MFTEAIEQQPCTHCGECVRACPEDLNPEALFFALVADDFDGARGGRLDACTDCNRCVEVCPSHIPLLDWFRWGKGELAAREHADAARARYAARTARLASERTAHTPLRREVATPAAMPARPLTHAEVMAAIARGQAKRRRPR